MHEERTDVFSRSDGLSADDTVHLFENRVNDIAKRKPTANRRAIAALAILRPRRMARWKNC